MQPNYRIYATLLDSYFNYLNSDVIYERYYGWSENPPYTEEEFRQKQFQELIDRINRRPFDSEAADKGTAFNEVIDAKELVTKQVNLCITMRFRPTRL